MQIGPVFQHYTWPALTSAFFCSFFPALMLFFPKYRLVREAVECTAVWHMYTAKHLTFAFVKDSNPLPGIRPHLVFDLVPAHALGMEQ